MKKKLTFTEWLKKMKPLSDVITLSTSNKHAAAQFFKKMDQRNHVKPN